MTPEEKCKELIDKFRNEYKWVETDYAVDLYRDAIQCALICVDEVIKVCQFVNDKRARAFPETVEEFNAPSADFISYWEQVKEEIIKN